MAEPSRRSESLNLLLAEFIPPSLTFVNGYQLSMINTLEELPTRNNEY